MFWNLFERIINAVKPSRQEQPSDETHVWPENTTDQPKEAQEDFSSPQEPVGTTPQQNNWQD